MMFKKTKVDITEALDTFCGDPKNHAGFVDVNFEIIEGTPAADLKISERANRCRFKNIKPDEINDDNIDEILHHERECGIVSWLRDKWQEKNPGAALFLKIRYDGAKQDGEIH